MPTSSSLGEAGAAPSVRGAVGCIATGGDCSGGGSFGLRCSTVGGSAPGRSCALAQGAAKTIADAHASRVSAGGKRRRRGTRPTQYSNRAELATLGCFFELRRGGEIEDRLRR